MSKRSACIGVQAILMASLMAASAWGHGESVRFTSFATIEIKPPLITGTLWLELEAVEALFHVDRNGDGQYTENEVWGVRVPVKRYLDERLPMMWLGRVHPFEVDLLELARRPGMGHDFVKITFKVRDLPPGAPVEIVSRLLHDLSATAECMALIIQGERTEVFVLGPWDYYRSLRAPLPELPNSFFRPRAQRGRFVVARDLCLEMLYALPEGSFRLYFFEDDRETPRAIRAKPITASIQPVKRNARPVRVTLTPEPLSVDKTGYCSRFVGAAPQLKSVGVENYTVEMELGAGPEHRRLNFEIPTVVILSEEEIEQASRRYACPNLCLGVESKRQSDTCVRCGAGMVEAHGAAVPGVGRIGRHGGPMSLLRSHRFYVEALLPSPHEIRFYFTDEQMRPRSAEGVSMKVLLGAQEMSARSAAEAELRLVEDGAYLAAGVPEQMRVPLVVRCVFSLEEGDRSEAVNFYLHEIISPGG